MEAIHICFSIMYIVNEFKEIIHKIEISGNRTAIWQSFAGPAGWQSWQCADAKDQKNDYDYDVNVLM